MTQANSEPYRQALVSSMQTRGSVRSDTIIQAFLRIPREAFVPFFYQRRPASRKLEWERLDSSHEQYLELIYRDEPLVTRVDERGWPISSSSQPSVMALMLEALDLKSGQHVLEIGTGTGYNAALLATITGQPEHVTTVDINPQITAHAQRALHTVIGPGVHVFLGDGIFGYDAKGPYERIIATASAPTIPSAWLHQLAPGGKLVMDLQGSLASSLLVLEKQGQSVNGMLFDTPLYFMPLISDHIAHPSAHIDYARYLRQPCREAAHLEKEHPFPLLLQQDAFRWFLQWNIPGCQIRERELSGKQEKHIFLIDSRRQTILRFLQEERGWQVSVYGPQPLWTDVQHLYEQWKQAGKPEKRSDYAVQIQGKSIILSTAHLIIPLAENA
uniref:Protein-L-isoaspartate O-methyltransferase n=1 Tax=Thermosporothrix sp. COM3 TaxID=2490863 RepID=A0A455STF9_9CHLR|nr:hypothetical protein KTC_64640 [Thermosporothrix sp. COM3]